MLEALILSEEDKKKKKKKQKKRVVAEQNLDFSQKPEVDQGDPLPEGRTIAGLESAPSRAEGIGNALQGISGAVQTAINQSSAPQPSRTAGMDFNSGIMDNAPPRFPELAIEAGEGGFDPDVINPPAPEPSPESQRVQELAQLQQKRELLAKQPQINRDESWWDKTKDVLKNAVVQGGQMADRSVAAGRTPSINELLFGVTRGGVQAGLDPAYDEKFLGKESKAYRLQNIDRDLLSMQQQVQADREDAMHRLKAGEQFAKLTRAQNDAATAHPAFKVAMESKNVSPTVARMFGIPEPRNWEKIESEIINGENYLRRASGTKYFPTGLKNADDAPVEVIDKATGAVRYVVSAKEAARMEAAGMRYDLGIRQITERVRANKAREGNTRARNAETKRHNQRMEAISAARIASKGEGEDIQESLDEFEAVTNELWELEVALSEAKGEGGSTIGTPSQIASIESDIRRVKARQERINLKLRRLRTKSSTAGKAIKALTSPAIQNAPTSATVILNNETRRIVRERLGNPNATDAQIRKYIRDAGGKVQ